MSGTHKVTVANFLTHDFHICIIKSIGLYHQVRHSA